MIEQTTALTVVERARKALVIKQTEDELKALAAKTADITTITNADGRQQVHAAYMVLKNERIDIQKRGKEARDDATKFSKAVIVEEDRIIALISHEEDRLQKLRDDWDDAIEADKQAKIAAELQRVADLQDRVAELRGNRMLSPTSGSELIAEHISDLVGVVVDESFGEYREQAEAAKADGLQWLNDLHVAAVAHETEQARIKAEREELAKLRAEQAERDRLAEIERKALAEKQAAEAAVERARIAEEERQAKAARDAEAAKQAEELRQMRLTQQQVADAERKRIADEEAAAKAIRDAEAKKLADERAEFERQQAEARRVKEEQERAERERARLASIKKPADEELLGVLAKHYGVPVTKVVEWLLAVDFTSMENAA